MQSPLRNNLEVRLPPFREFSSMQNCCQRILINSKLKVIHSQTVLILFFPLKKQLEDGILVDLIRCSAGEGCRKASLSMVLPRLNLRDWEPCFFCFFPRQPVERGGYPRVSQTVVPGPAAWHLGVPLDMQIHWPHLRPTKSISGDVAQKIVLRSPPGDSDEASSVLLPDQLAVWPFPGLPHLPCLLEQSLGGSSNG